MSQLSSKLHKGWHYSRVSVTVMGSNPEKWLGFINTKVRGPKSNKCQFSIKYLLKK